MKRPDYTSWLWINFKIGAFSVGAASRTLIYEEEVVHRRGWLTEDEFREALTLGQVLPGPNLVTTAACVGFKLFPTWSAVVAVFPLVLPGALIVVLAALWLPLSNPSVAQLFRGFAIGAFLLMGRFLWVLWKGLSVKASASQKDYKAWSRYVLAGGFSLLIFEGAPILPLVATGVVFCLGWEFLV